jgi:gas vesicle protein
MKTKTNTRSIWPYIIVGSAVGGAIACLNVTESGRRVRRSLTHPAELANSAEKARSVVEAKARAVAQKVHDVLDRAKEGLEAGQREFEDAGNNYRSGLQRRIEGKNEEVAAKVHRAVDDVSRTATTFEQSVLDPLYEIAAIYRGAEKAVRTVFRRSAAGPEVTSSNMPTPIYSDQRLMG